MFFLCIILNVVQDVLQLVINKYLHCTLAFSIASKDISSDMNCIELRYIQLWVDCRNWGPNRGRVQHPSHCTTLATKQFKQSAHLGSRDSKQTPNCPKRCAPMFGWWATYVTTRAWSNLYEIYKSPCQQNKSKIRLYLLKGHYSFL